jgi:hypothetical protein
METSNKAEVKSYLDWAFKGRSAWWIYLIGVVFIFLLMTIIKDILGVPLIVFFTAFVFKSQKTLASALITKNSVFLVVFILTPLFVWLVHRRPGWSVAFPKFRFEGWNMGMGFLFSWLTLLATYASYALFGGVRLSIASIDLQIYLPLLGAGIIMFLIQTSSEELVFRGYILQALHRFRTGPVLMILLTGLAFALPHLPNLVGMHMPWYAVVVYLTDGCLLAYLAYRTGSLWMPIGWHFANNLLLTTFIGVPNSGDVIEGLDIIVADKIPSLGIIVLAKLLPSLVMVLILTWLINRRDKTNGA